MNYPRIDWRFFWWYGGIASVLVAFAVMSGVHHDYIEYLKQWEIIWQGNNPWLNADGSFTGNAYGPSHVLLAYAYALHPMLPKAIGAGAYLLFTLYLLMQYSALHQWQRPKTKLLLWYLFAPFFLVEVFYYGDIDVYIALLVLACFMLLQKKQEFWAGACLAGAICFKFFPIIYLPFLVLPQKKPIRWIFCFSSLGFSILAFVWCFSLWGWDTLTPITFASGRGATLLSIFRYLEGAYSPLVLVNNAPVAVSFLSLPLMAISGGVLFLCYLRRCFDELTACVLGTLFVFLWYKVGHQQFYIVFLLLLAYWYLEYFVMLNSLVALKRSLIIFAVWLSLFCVLYKWMGSFNFDPWRPGKEIVGLLHFGFMLYLAKNILKASIPINAYFNETK